MFEITQDDLYFYDKVSPVIAGKMYKIPPPAHCSECRQQRRLTWRNECKLYNRKCGLCSQQIISYVAPEKSFTVYCQKCWWSDQWDPFSYGVDFDFSRPFFEQFSALQQRVPRLSLLAAHNENSDYTNYVSHLKNCYLIFSSDFNRDCFYGLWIENSQNCVDNLLIDHCELTYESFFSQQLYNCAFVVHSSLCTDSAFLFDCKNCSNCFMSFGLRNKQYYIRNKQYSKEEYGKYMQQYGLGNYSIFFALRTEFLQLMQNAPRLLLYRNGRIESSTGDFLTDVENCQSSFEVLRGKDCRYVQGVFDLKNVMDCSYVSGELGYENCECVPMPYQSAFNINSYSGNTLFYTDTCMSSCSDCFGCVGLRHQKYCILNKQYSKEGYEALVPRIIERMIQTGEWGEFFPSSLSPFAYNETVASEYYPLSKEQALSNGYRWRDDDEINTYQGPVVTLPDSIKDTSDDITKQILRCEVTGKLYKIIPQELAFYRQMGLPVPRRCPDQRHKDRMALRNPRKLYQRSCQQCGKSIHTTYSEERSEKVYCEQCYLAAVY